MRLCSRCALNVWVHSYMYKLDRSVELHATRSRFGCANQQHPYSLHRDAILLEQKYGYVCHLPFSVALCNTVDRGRRPQRYDVRVTMPNQEREVKNEEEG